jgi:hypothetical protein
MAFNQTPGREKFPSTGNGIPTEFRQDNEPPTNKATREREIQNSASRLVQQQMGFDAKAKDGYSGKDVAQAKSIISKSGGALSSGGSSYNFNTGEEKIEPYRYNYAKPKGGVKGRVFNSKTKELVKEASYSDNASNKNTYSGSFKNPKELLSEQQLYQGFVKDSVDDQTRKRLNLANLKNTKRVAGY